ncbi:lysylphosphatidylglycerol synthase transmembrane domain-containing protein [Tractidigestivibacter sp.]|uniref:lysylphosphatidylglycerol synthase transmembrane domain-containing protein n=1 Tax=Tractidigestivibacter sp. TaxID=2847320 RepID=UPI002A91A4C5|nr:lysylphosphatidylglycerol synthase transmembrane domain-containing protein [Tractidigestivibacter sp.]MDY5271125.1 lysylphosphatidylglycerol synthase transmembrane domain-containing protein [Tractidigestivibacter sp.]
MAEDAEDKAPVDGGARRYDAKGGHVAPASAGPTASAGPASAPAATPAQKHPEARPAAAPAATPAQRRPRAPKPQVVGARASSPRPRHATGGSPKVATAGTGAKVKFRVNAVKAVSAQDREADKQSMGQVRKSLVFLGGVTLAYLAYLILSGQMGVFISSLSQVDNTWIVRGAICYLVYYVIGVSAYVLSVIMDPNSPVGVRDLMSVEAAGIFFMNLTPNGMGAAPAQIYRLTRAGLSVGGAGALHSTRFIMYEAGEGIFAAIMLAFRLDYFLDAFGDFIIIGILLFALKVLECVVLFAICAYPKFFSSAGNWVLRFANKRGWVKDYDHWYQVVNNQIMEFSDGFRSAAKNKGDLVGVLVLTLLQLGCLYALPWFVLNAFGKQADLVTCLASGSMLELLTSAIPLPGGTGGAEGGFALLFGGMFGMQASAGFVLWRAVEYFLPTLCVAPLLGLRSTSGESINHRFRRYGARLRRLFSRGGGGKGSGGIKVTFK